MFDISLLFQIVQEACQLKRLAEVYSNVLDYLLPELCRLCGGPSRRGICDGCRAEFSKLLSPCAGCGLEKPVRQCPREAAVWHVSSVAVPLRYEFPLTTQIHALKYLYGRNLGRALGLMLAEYLRNCVDLSTVDALVAVPLHRSRLITRGYNQALEIALPVAAEFNLPLILAGIARSRRGSPQSALNLQHRRVNVDNAFSVSKNLSGHRLAIIDDVITTGATINALAAALRRAGADDVRAWAVARTL